LKPKLFYKTFKNSVHTSKRTPHFIIIEIILLMLFKEIIAVHSEKHIKPINTKKQHYRLLREVGHIYLPLGFKGLKLYVGTIDLMQ
jgi:hypothetical protein